MLIVLDPAGRGKVDCQRVAGRGTYRSLEWTFQGAAGIPSCLEVDLDFATRAAGPASRVAAAVEVPVEAVEVRDSSLGRERLTAAWRDQPHEVTARTWEGLVLDAIVQPPAAQWRQRLIVTSP